MHDGAASTDSDELELSEDGGVDDLVEEVLAAGSSSSHTPTASHDDGVREALGSTPHGSLTPAEHSSCSSSTTLTDALQVAFDVPAAQDEDRGSPQSSTSSGVQKSSLPSRTDIRDDGAVEREPGGCSNVGDDVALASGAHGRSAQAVESDFIAATQMVCSRARETAEALEGQHAAMTDIHALLHQHVDHAEEGEHRAEQKIAQMRATEATLEMQREEYENSVQELELQLQTASDNIEKQQEAVRQSSISARERVAEAAEEKDVLLESLLEAEEKIARLLGNNREMQLELHRAESAVMEQEEQLEKQQRNGSNHTAEHKSMQDNLSEAYNERDRAQMQLMQEEDECVELQRVHAELLVQVQGMETAEQLQAEKSREEAELSQAELEMQREEYESCVHALELKLQTASDNIERQKEAAEQACLSAGAAEDKAALSESLLEAEEQIKRLSGDNREMQEKLQRAESVMTEHEEQSEKNVRLAPSSLAEHEDLQEKLAEAYREADRVQMHLMHEEDECLELQRIQAALQVDAQSTEVAERLQAERSREAALSQAALEMKQEELEKTAQELEEKLQAAFDKIEAQQEAVHQNRDAEERGERMSRSHIEMQIELQQAEAAITEQEEQLAKAAKQLHLAQCDAAEHERMQDTLAEAYSEKEEAQTRLIHEEAECLELRRIHAAAQVEVQGMDTAEQLQAQERRAEAEFPQAEGSHQCATSPPASTTRWTRKVGTRAAAASNKGTLVSSQTQTIEIDGELSSTSRSCHTKHGGKFQDLHEMRHSHFRQLSNHLRNPHARAAARGSIQTATDVLDRSLHMSAQFERSFDHRASMEPEHGRPHPTMAPPSTLRPISPWRRQSVTPSLSVPRLRHADSGMLQLSNIWPPTWDSTIRASSSTCLSSPRQPPQPTAERSAPPAALQRSRSAGCLGATSLGNCDASPRPRRSQHALQFSGDRGVQAHIAWKESLRSSLQANASRATPKANTSRSCSIFEDDTHCAAASMIDMSPLQRMCDRSCDSAVDASVAWAQDARTTLLEPAHVSRPNTLDGADSRQRAAIALHKVLQPCFDEFGPMPT